MADKTKSSTATVAVTFSTTPQPLEKAAPVFRTAVGIVNPLAHGLLGRKPMAAGALGIDLKRHECLRKFKTEEELRWFYDYLEELLAHARELGHDKLARVELNRKGAFMYTSANGRAQIALIPVRRDWRIQGSVKMFDPSICAKALSGNGFRVKISA